jgi:hypothetical protein
MTRDVRPSWDNQFAETEYERNERLATARKARLTYDKARRTIVDPSDSTRTGMFVLHSCWKCGDGAKPCAQGSPRQCEFPRARND